MGKKRVALIGDVFEEEITRKKRAIQREQKKIRQGETIEEENRTDEEEIKKIKELKELKELSDKKKPQEEKARSAKVSGMKGGERVVDTATESMAELERLKKKELELEQLAAEAKGQDMPVKKKKQKVRSLRYQAARQRVTDGKDYPLAEAVMLVRDLNLTKFPATVELHLNLIKQEVFGNQAIDLPHGIGMEKRVAVVSDALLKKLESGTVNFDVLLAQPKDMPKLVKYAKLLGPKGLMPNPKTGTIVDDPEKVKGKFGADTRLEIKAEKKAPLIHTVAGKLSMKDEQLEENVKAIIKAVGRKNIKKGYLTSTMSPSIRIAM